MNGTFYDRLERAWKISGSLLCVGLDPERKKFPAHLQSAPDGLFEFCAAIVEATKDFVCAYKPQIAFFAAERAEESLERLVRYIREVAPHALIVLDSKRGDIGNTAEQYAREAFVRFDADVVTLNPYLGFDSLKPFLDYPDRGAFLLCRTSNPGAKDLQDLEVGGKKLYEMVAEKAAHEWNGTRNVGLVVGATYPAELKRVRDIVGDLPLLVPGVGAQGGSIREVMANGAITDRTGTDRTGAGRTGLVINVSRAVLYAGSGEDFAECAAEAAKALTAEIKAG